MANSKNNVAPFGSTQEFVKNYMAAAADGKSAAEFCKEFHKSKSGSKAARQALSQKVAGINRILEKEGETPLPSLERSARTGGVGAGIAALVRDLRRPAPVNEVDDDETDDDETDDDE